MNALGGTFTGMADIPEFKRFKVNGRVEGVSIGTVTQVTGLKPIPYGGDVTGPVEVTGSIGAKDLKAAGKFDVTPGASGVPVQGGQVGGPDLLVQEVQCSAGVDRGELRGIAEKPDGRTGFGREADHLRARERAGLGRK